MGFFLLLGLLFLQQSKSFINSYNDNSISSCNGSHDLCGSGLTKLPIEVMTMIGNRLEAPFYYKFRNTCKYTHYCLPNYMNALGRVLREQSLLISYISSRNSIRLVSFGKDCNYYYGNRLLLRHVKEFLTNDDIYGDAMMEILWNLVERQEAIIFNKLHADVMIENEYVGTVNLDVALRTLIMKRGILLSKRDLLVFCGNLQPSITRYEYLLRQSFENETFNHTLSFQSKVKDQSRLLELVLGLLGTLTRSKSSPQMTLLNFLLNRNQMFSSNELQVFLTRVLHEFSIGRGCGGNFETIINALKNQAVWSDEGKEMFVRVILGSSKILDQITDFFLQDLLISFYPKFFDSVTGLPILTIIPICHVLTLIPHGQSLRDKKPAFVAPYRQALEVVFFKRIIDQAIVIITSRGFFELTVIRSARYVCEAKGIFLKTTSCYQLESILLIGLLTLGREFFISEAKGPTMRMDLVQRQLLTSLLFVAFLVIVFLKIVELHTLIWYGAIFITFIETFLNLFFMIDPLIRDPFTQFSM